MFIALAVALVATLAGGATMAWFTDSAAVNDVTFSAGTLAIEADQSIPVETTSFEIVNPGDAYCVGWEVENVGTKRAELRFDGVTSWGNFELDSLADPAHIAICPNYQDDWKIAGNDEGGFAVYYTKGPVMPGKKAKLVLVVAFDGPEMVNNFQEKTFALSGKFEAVQASHGAAEELWGTDWKTAGSFDLDGYFANYGSEDWPECCGDNNNVTTYYTVTFDSKGGSAVDSITVKEGNAIGTLPSPSKGGHTFAGWFKGEDFINPFTETTAVYDNITIYAKWDENKVYHTVTVYVYPAGATGSVGVWDKEASSWAPLGSSVNVEVDTTVQLTAQYNGPDCLKCWNWGNGRKQCTILLGWSESQGGPMVDYVIPPVSIEAGGQYTFTMPERDITLYANYGCPIHGYNYN